MNKRISLLIFLYLFSTLNFFAQTAAQTVESFDPSYKINFQNPVQDKNFYLLSLMQNQSKVRKSLQKNKSLRSLSKQHYDSLKDLYICDDAKCSTDVFRLSDQEIDLVADFLSSSAKDSALKDLVENHLRPSGMFIKYAGKTDAEMLTAAWRDAAKNLNRILDVYGLGKPPTYKDIDSVSYDINSSEYRQLLKTKTAQIKFSREDLFFEPTLNFAMKLLEINRRDEAGRFEPLEKSENKKAFESVKKVNWNDYPYSVILVLGSGPSASLGDAPNIGKIGMARADEGVKLFQEKKAPFIVLSGGYVHPMQTPYCEALEMKKYIMQKYGIAEENILVDPYARHTTTNVRNTVRMIFRYVIPTDKKGLITSSQTHIDYVMGEAFIKRNLDEPGVLPMQIFNRLSPVAVEFKPLADALFMNAGDPLDP